MQPWFLQFCNAKVLIESLLINPVQRIPRYTLLLEDLWKNTPSTHPDDENLLKAITFVKKVAAHVNLSVAKNQNFDKLTSEGLEHLLAAHRILVIDGDLAVSKIVEFRKKKADRAGKFTLKILVFNDIVVFFDRSITDKKEIKKREESWPLELVWLERDPGNNDSFSLVGPTKRFLISFQQPDIFERWWQAIGGAVDRQLEATQLHLKGSSPPPPLFSLTQGSEPALPDVLNPLTSGESTLFSSRVWCTKAGGIEAISMAKAQLTSWAPSMRATLSRIGGMVTVCCSIPMDIATSATSGTTCRVLPPSSFCSRLTSQTGRAC